MPEVQFLVVVSPVEIECREGDLDLMREWRKIGAAQAEDDTDLKKTQRASTRHLQVQREVTKAHDKLDLKVE